MSKSLRLLPILAIIPTLSACSFLTAPYAPQHVDHTPVQHYGGYAHTSQPAQQTYGQSYDPCNPVMCAGTEVYSAAGYQTQDIYAPRVGKHFSTSFDTQFQDANYFPSSFDAPSYAPALRRAPKVKKPNQEYSYFNLGGVKYDSGFDSYGVEGRFGYQSPKIWGAEIEGSIGIKDDSETVATTVTKEGTNFSVGAFALARLPISERFSVHGRGGYHVTESFVEVDDSTTVVKTTNEVDGFAYGAGVGFALSPRDAIRADYTVYEGGASNRDTISLAYARRF